MEVYREHPRYSDVINNDNIAYYNIELPVMNFNLFSLAAYKKLIEIKMFKINKKMFIQLYKRSLM